MSFTTDGDLVPAGLRTAYCGALRAADAGRSVSVCGWVARRREHGEHLAFVDLRDHTGIVQCVVDGANDLRAEYVLRITGTVRPRPEGTVNPALSTGEVEIGDCEVEILSSGRAPAVLPRRPGGDRRGGAASLPLLGPAYRAHAAQPAATGAGEQRPAKGDGAPGLRRGRDAAAVDADSRGCTRVRHPVPVAARVVLRLAAEPPDR